MRAMRLDSPGGRLRLVEVASPEPKAGEVLVAVSACGVCRTDLHIVDGDITDGVYPVIPGHQIVGEVVRSEVPEVAVGQRVGIPWLGYTCGHCDFCRTGMENLCGAPIPDPAPWERTESKGDDRASDVDGTR